MNLINRWLVTASFSFHNWQFVYVYMYPCRKWTKSDVNTNNIKTNDPFKKQSHVQSRVSIKTTRGRDMKGIKLTTIYVNLCFMTKDWISCRKIDQKWICMSLLNIFFMKKRCEKIRTTISVNFCQTNIVNRAGEVDKSNTKIYIPIYWIF